ncbi:MAG TPA: NAD-dependent epimerase/dehydratase family protein [Epulopiscium sp.]|nr:NAD-dependent epimerase/dehydratase family protein [Candidatus Epulonipiscium sp.]
MKVLLIGGTGRISLAISNLLLTQGHELYLVNRGNLNTELTPGNINFINCDINDEDKLNDLLDGMTFDVVADFIAFTPKDLERDYRLFKDKTKQFIFISSASAYHKPPKDYLITEGTSLSNPYWQYSRDKIDCEDYLMKMYREQGFPITIVRPSHTYDHKSIPVGVHGNKGSWQVIKRMLQGKSIIIHGDGTSLWTLTHNRDFAKGFVGLIGNTQAIGEAIQITSDESITWNQIYQSIANALGVSFNPYYVSSTFLGACNSYDFNGNLIGDKANCAVFDNSKLKRLVPGFQATITFDQGVKEAISYLLEHPEQHILDPEFDSWCDLVIRELNNATERINA